jgi:hypothetical protein
LIEVDDEALLDTLLASKETCMFFRRRLSPTMAEVNLKHLAAVQECLWQHKCLPALSSATTLEATLENSSTLQEPQWQLDNDGLLQLCYAVPNLYLVAEVERFCERDEATSRHKITASSLRRALKQGITFEYIIRFLQQYCDGGIPAALLIRLKLWGDGYGNKHYIQVEQAPLLRLAEEVLHDLVADKELGALLGPEVEQQARLVRVDPDNLERVIALLHERGFSVE